MRELIAMDGIVKNRPQIKPHDKVLYFFFSWLPRTIKPNHLSGLRCFLAVPIILLMWGHYYKLCGALFLFAAILDGLDGSLARIRNQETKIGAYLDPLADKIVNATTFLGFLWGIKEDYYLYLIIPIIGIDILLFCIATLKLSIQKLSPKKWFLARKLTITKAGANAYGKVKMVIQVIVISFLLIFDPNTSVILHEKYHLLPDHFTLLYLASPLLVACIILGLLSLYGHILAIKKKKETI